MFCCVMDTHCCIMLQKVDRTIRKAPPSREHSKGKIFFGDQYEVNNVYADVGPGTK